MGKQRQRDPNLTIHTAESRIRHPLLLLREMWLDLLASKELAWRLVIRDISAMYRQTALGYFWAVFPPIVTTAVFILLNSSRVINIKNIDVPYPVYVMVGTVFWQLFVDALNAPLKVVTEAKTFLSKINFPREALIISGMGQVLFSFLVKLVLLVIVLLFFKVEVNLTLLLTPVPIIALLLLGTMFGVLLIPVGLLYKDIQSSLLIATAGLVFISPVAYGPDVGGILGEIMAYNPVTPLLESTRALLFKGIPHELTPFFIVFAATFVLLFLGWIIYRLALPIIVERLGA